MAIGERIHFFRNLRGMTQKYLGQLLCFPEKSADVRLAQYETGVRTPKSDLTTSRAAMHDMFLKWNEQAKNWKTAKSQKKNTINGGITTRSLNPVNNGVLLVHYNF